MHIYEFQYDFGPYEGNYVFFLKQGSSSTKEFRQNAINHCKKLIEDELASEQNLMLEYSKHYPNEDTTSMFNHSLSSLQEKLDDLNNHIEVFIETGSAYISTYRNIRLIQRELLIL